MPDLAKAGETASSTPLDESQRRVIAFFALLSKMPVGDEDAQEARTSDEVPPNDKG
ncbi:hypothetical protein QPK87_11035 [Kamptonema cortianum]|nr:hypothetical protein [Kamptonema cortianum]